MKQTYSVTVELIAYPTPVPHKMLARQPFDSVLSPKLLKIIWAQWTAIRMMTLRSGGTIMATIVTMEPDTGCYWD